MPLGQVATLLYLAPEHLPPGVETTAAAADYGFDGDAGGWAQAHKYPEVSFESFMAAWVKDVRAGEPSILELGRRFASV